jgi:N-acetylmuramoyl-L-alanine amidase
MGYTVPTPLIDPDWLAALTIRMEADAEPYAGKVAVGEVIRERMRRGYFSDGTVAGTVLRPFQFSCWNTSAPSRGAFACAMRESPASQEAWKAWQESMTSSLVPGAMLYHTEARPPGVSDWPPAWAAASIPVRQIGKHIFYSTGRT